MWKFKEPDLVPNGIYSVVTASKKLGVCRQTLYACYKNKEIRNYGKRSLKFLGEDLIRLWKSKL